MDRNLLECVNKNNPTTFREADGSTSLRGLKTVNEYGKRLNSLATKRTEKQCLWKLRSAISRTISNLPNYKLE